VAGLVAGFFRILQDLAGTMQILLVPAKNPDKNPEKIESGESYRLSWFKF
jgi:hypothetical protein